MWLRHKQIAIVFFLDLGVCDPLTQRHMTEHEIRINLEPEGVCARTATRLKLVNYKLDTMRSKRIGWCQTAAALLSLAGDSYPPQPAMGLSKPPRPHPHATSVVTPCQRRPWCTPSP